MTVCVAARCTGDIVLGASDRMLTAGDVQFEPDTAKMHPLTASIACMTAGDSSFQIEILREVKNVIDERVRREPDNWWLVRDVAYLYARVRNEIRRKRAEQTILLPLGLAHESFIARQKGMSDEFISKITKELINFDVPDVETIFAGVDTYGSHIYTVENDKVRCHDSVGFAAIGIGYWHANSQFMLAGHNYEAPMPVTFPRLLHQGQRS